MTTGPNGVLAIALLLFSGCAGQGSSPRSERGHGVADVRVYGALHAMVHQGRTDAVVTLDALLPDPRLYAVGALADLAGEITIVGGRAYLSKPEGGSGVRVEAVPRSPAGAALLVAADVASWEPRTVREPIAFEDLDAAVAAIAREAGFGPDERIPFLIEGEVEGLEWHVLGGPPPGGKGGTHEDHLANAVRRRADRCRATLVGFYSAHDQGVFTHRDRRTHVHCVLEGARGAGHVDRVTIPAGARISFPVR